MNRRTDLLVLAMSVVLATVAHGQEAPTASTIAPAVPGSWEHVAGQTILYYVNGRTLEEAGGAGFNPFGIDGEGLLFSLGSFFITADYNGESVHEGEVSIFPQFVTPRGGAFETSPATPPIISFAMMKAGACYGGYVTGHPVPDAIFAVDMSGQLCHAAIVDETVYGYYQMLASLEPNPPPDSTAEIAFDPHNPLDVDLEVAVWVAYRAAFAIATADADYLFTPGGDYALLRDAIVAALDREGLGAVGVAASPATSPHEALGCARQGSVELRVALSAANTGIKLVAASPRRMASYAYDPEVSADLVVEAARTCRTAGLGRVDSVNEP